MSIFNGKFSRRDELTGTLIPDRELTGQLESKQPLSGAMRPVGGVMGSLREKVRFVSAGIRPLTVLYRFLGYRGILRTGKKARASAAPAVDLAADSTIQADKAAPLTAQPAQDLAVNQRERLKVSVRLAAYRRAGLAYLRRLFFRRRAALGTAPGVAAEYHKVQPVKLTAKPEAATGAILESLDNTVETGCTAAGAAAQGTTVPGVTLGLASTHKAQAGKAAVVDVGTNNPFRAAHSAKLAVCFPPEQVGNRLVIYQAESAIQSGNRVAIDTETDRIYWANPYLVGNRLQIAFAATAEQTENRLELS